MRIPSLKKQRKYLKQFEDTKGVIRSGKSKDRQYNGQYEKTIGQTMIYTALRRKLKIEQHKLH
jgi:hypothetical protein